MVDISNKTMALLLVAAMFVSLGGTMVTLNTLGSGITGFASHEDTGTANITIQGDLSIAFTTAQVDLGTGYTNDTDSGGPTMEYCTFDTNGTNPSGDCVGFNNDTSPFTIENIGNQDATLNLRANATAAQFIGGDTPVFEFAMEEPVGETGSCTGTLTEAWTTVPTSDTPVCTSTGFRFETDNDALNLHVRVSIPQDAPTRTNQVIFTATAENP